MNGRSRPGKDGPEEITCPGDSNAKATKMRAIAVRYVARSILFDPAPYGDTADEDLAVRLHAASAVVSSVPGLTIEEQDSVSRSLPWREAIRRVHTSERWSR